MLKTFIAQNIIGIDTLQFEVKDGVVIGLSLNAQINYGEMGLTHQLKIWDDLTDTGKKQAQAIYKALFAITKHLLLEVE